MGLYPTERSGVAGLQPRVAYRHLRAWRREIDISIGRGLEDGDQFRSVPAIVRERFIVCFFLHHGLPAAALRAAPFPPAGSTTLLSPRAYRAFFGPGGLPLRGWLAGQAGDQQGEVSARSCHSLMSVAFRDIG